MPPALDERYGVRDSDVSEPDASAALEQMRAPGFAMLGPASIATVGRKPRTT